jgi:hypothetical protein
LLGIAVLMCPLWIQTAHGEELQTAMRAEWTVERTARGEPRLAGYVHNDNGLRDATNVLLRVEQLAPDGAVVDVRRARLVGDVQSRGRLAFAVPVATESATYRVVVDSVTWVDECR